MRLIAQITIGLLFVLTSPGFGQKNATNLAPEVLLNQKGKDPREMTIREIVLTPAIKPPQAPVALPSSNDTRELSQKMERLIQASDEKGRTILSKLLAEYLQLETEIPRLESEYYISNPVFAKCAAYRIAAPAWLRKMHQEDAGFTGNPPLTNKQVFIDLAAVFTPIITRELLEDSEWGPLLFSKIKTETERKIPADLSFAWAADPLLGLRPPDLSNTNSHPSMDYIKKELETRVGLAVAKIISLMNSNQVSPSAIRYVKVMRQATVLIGTAEYYEVTHANGILLSKKARAKSLRIQLERRTAKTAIPRGREL